MLTNKSGETMRKSLNKAMEIGLGLEDDQPETRSTIAPPTEAEMKEYVGVYSHAPQTWEVLLKNGKMFVKFEDKEYLATKSGERKFTFGLHNPSLS